jgi:uncharacterized protein (TIGR03000 family)
LLVPGVAAAQSRIAWRIIIGAPPDPDYQDVEDGGRLAPRGYSPGYGYYDDYIKWAPSIVITNQPPRPALPFHPGPEAFGSAAPAQVRVFVPADAELWFSDQPTLQRGTVRLFVTAPLQGDQAFTYEVRGRWQHDGRQVERTQTVVVHAGDRVTVDLLRPADDEGPTLLPPPRKLQTP